MTITIGVSAVLGVSLFTLLSASEIQVRDLRLAVGIGPSLTAFGGLEIDAGIARDGSLCWSGANIYTHGGFAWAAGLAMAHGESDLLTIAPAELSYRRIGPVGRFAYAYAFTRSIHMEAGVFASIGFLNVRTRYHSDGSDNSSGGVYAAIGPLVAIYAEAGAGIVIGLEVEYRSEVGSVVSYDSGPTGGTQAKGVAARLAAGYRF